MIFQVGTVPLLGSTKINISFFSVLNESHSSIYLQCRESTVGISGLGVCAWNSLSGALGVGAGIDLSGALGVGAGIDLSGSLGVSAGFALSGALGTCPGIALSGALGTCPGIALSGALGTCPGIALCGALGTCPGIALCGALGAGLGLGLGTSNGAPERCTNTGFSIGIRGGIDDNRRRSGLRTRSALGAGFCSWKRILRLYSLASQSLPCASTIVIERHDCVKEQTLM